eukprot:5401021-Prymnesium_polylepis.1
MAAVAAWTRPSLSLRSCALGAVRVHRGSGRRAVRMVAGDDGGMMMPSRVHALWSSRGGRWEGSSVLSASAFSRFTSFYH